MQYQVSYLSPNGHARKVAEAITDILPPDTKLLDLQESCEVYAETLIIGFELNEASIRAVPYPIMELLNELKNHQVLVFVTSPFKVDINARSVLEYRIAPFIPGGCQYRGLFLCPGQASACFLNEVRKNAEQHPEDHQAKAFLAHCEESIGHPDETDLLNACHFVADALRLAF